MTVACRRKTLYLISYMKIIIY